MMKSYQKQGDLSPLLAMLRMAAKSLGKDFRKAAREDSAHEGKYMKKRTPMSTLRTKDLEGDISEDAEHGQDAMDPTIRSRMNALIAENQALRGKESKAVDAKPVKHEDDHALMATAMANSLMPVMNTLIQNQNSFFEKYGQGAGKTTVSPYQMPSPQVSQDRRRPRSNAVQPQDTYGPAANKMPRSNLEGRVDRYLHNPIGHEVWKKWLRVCNNCGCYVAHFGNKCKNKKRPNFNPKDDPRTCVPIENHPATRAAALERCRQEFQTYGANVRWNCLDNQAPSPQKLA